MKTDVRTDFLTWVKEKTEAAWNKASEDDLL
jgi:hypothetical protein